jgi:hypothetical protein
MKIVYHALTFLMLTFGLFFGTGLLIIAVNGQETNAGGDRIYHLLDDGLTFLLVLLCVIASILFIFLYKILQQLKALNRNQ